MMTHLISLTALALLCGLAWHNRSARESVRLETETKHDEGLRTNRPQPSSNSDRQKTKGNQHQESMKIRVTEQVEVSP
jgi:hypothetical protein